MHCPFTSEISVKREHGILIPVMRYFYFLYVRDSCVGPPFTPLFLVLVTTFLNMSTYF